MYLNPPLSLSSIFFDLSIVAHSKNFSIEIVKKMRPDWPLLGVGIFSAAVAGATNPVFAYLLGTKPTKEKWLVTHSSLGKIIVILINPVTGRIAPGPMDGANLYAFLFGT